jgi:hypothetical protein
VNNEDGGTTFVESDQGELNFFFWVGDAGDSLSVTEEEFNELYLAAKRLQDDYKNVYYNEDSLIHEAELGYN